MKRLQAHLLHVKPNTAAHPLTAVLSKFHPSDDLLVDEVVGHIVLGRVVPGVEDLLPEEQPPGGVPLLGALLLRILLALRDGVHDVVAPAAQRRHLNQALSRTSVSVQATSYQTTLTFNRTYKLFQYRNERVFFTLSNRAMYSENPNRSLRLILSARALQSSLAVVAESARRVLVVPSINVTGNMMGFLDLVAWGATQ